MRPALVKDLAKALKQVDRPGTFCVSGAVPAVLPGFVVKEVGPIALPLTAAQAKELRGQCEQAPYGKGEKTLVDTSVRRVWRQVCLAKPRNKDGWAALCRTLGYAIIAALEEVDRASQAHDWRAAQVNRARVLADVVRALLATEQSDLLEQLVAHVLAVPQRYPLTDVQMPALVELQPWLKRHVKSASAALTAWLESCREQLETLTAEEPQEPTDFRRPAHIQVQVRTVCRAEAASCKIRMRACIASARARTAATTSR